jgi:hypothetical protein
MTESEWMTSAAPGRMIEHVGRSATLRKLRLLFAARLVRVSWQFAVGSQPPELTLNELADNLIGRPTAQTRLGLLRRPRLIQRPDEEDAPESETYQEVVDLAFDAQPLRTAHRLLDQLGELEAGLSMWDAEFESESDRQRTLSQIRKITASLIRDIFGNPFRPVAFVQRWRTADTVGLARGIYEDRAFDRMPLLGDALMDAGCADEQIISHCRSEGPHVRGCWVVDLVLAKE